MGPVQRRPDIVRQTGADDRPTDGARRSSTIVNDRQLQSVGRLSDEHPVDCRQLPVNWMLARRSSTIVAVTGS